MSPESAGSPPENNQAKESSWFAVGQADDIEADKGKSFELSTEQGDLNIAVFYHQGDYYALEDRCTHAKIPLVDGPIKDGCLMCPWHYAEFDLKTGAALSGPAVTAVATYPVRLNESDVIAVFVCD